MAVRAKFMCSSVEMAHPGPYTSQRYRAAGEDPVAVETWPRTYKFMATYDPDMPEDQRYADATPSGQLTIRVDNPAVEFVPGQYYYLDFTPVEG